MKSNKWLVTAIACCFSGAVFGAGFQLYTEGSAEALGQAGAISGRDDLISLAWYNPSALAGSERPSLMFGSTFAQIQTDFDGPAGSASMSDDWRTIPHFYYIQPINSNITAMLSVTAPYGLITEWSDNWPGRVVAIYSELHTIYTTPSISYRLNDKVAFSAGFNVVYGDAELTAYRNAAVGTREIKGDDIAYGYTFSGHFQPVEDWGMGIRYQSKVKLEPEGDIEYDLNPGAGSKFDVKGFADIPATVNFGVANSSIERLQLGLDFVWTEWSSYDELTFKFPTNPYEASPETLSKRWDNVWSIRFGGEYDLADSWVLRAGYVWDDSPVEGATRAPELPGSDRQMVMTGIGWKQNNIGIDLAYSYLWAKDAKTGSEVVAIVPSSAGEYETTTHLVALSGSYTF